MFLLHRINNNNNNNNNNNINIFVLLQVSDNTRWKDSNVSSVVTVRQNACMVKYLFIQGPETFCLLARLNINLPFQCLYKNILFVTVCRSSTLLDPKYFKLAVLTVGNGNIPYFWKTYGIFD
jgi:hypothetical protein